MLRARVGIEEAMEPGIRYAAYWYRRRGIRDMDQATFARGRDYHLAHRHALRALRIDRDLPTARGLLPPERT